jgi:peptidyl-prolyl cis-trans isomerase C
MKNKLLISILFVLCCEASIVGAVESPAVTVNSTPVPQSQLNAMVANFVAKGAKDGEELRKQITEELAAREAVAQEAVRLGLDKSASVTDALAIARRDILVNAFQTDYLAKHPISDAEVQALYMEQKQEAGDKEYRVRHVLVKSEAEAREIVAAIRKGEKLDALAREKSLDVSSRAAGGDIGWQLPIMLVPSVRDVVRNMTKGQVSEQVQSPYGWHVLKLEDTRPFEFPSIDKVRASLVQQLQSQQSLRAMSEIRNNAHLH